MQEIVLAFAEPAEEEAIRKLLIDADLPAEDFASHLQLFRQQKNFPRFVHLRLFVWPKSSASFIEPLTVGLMPGYN